MGKTAHRTLTRCHAEDKTLVIDKGVPFSMHGCKHGWISVDEYYESKRPSMKLMAMLAFFTPFLLNCQPIHIHENIKI